nr:hypothetical protein [Tanacetum cinerariifolium]
MEEIDLSLNPDEPNSRDFTMDVVETISPMKEPQVLNTLPTHPTLQLNLNESLFAYVVWIFLPFLVYSVVPQYLLSLRNEDIIFDPGICKPTFSKLDISHRCGTIKTFNTHRSHLNTFPMLIHGQNNPPLDVLFLHVYYKVIGWCVPDTPSHGADPSTHVTIRGSLGLRRFFRYAMFIYSFYLCYVLSLYPFTERYAQPYFLSCLIRQTFKTLCLLDYALMIRHDFDITSSLRRAALQLWYQSQTLLPQIRAEIREEFCTSSGPSNVGGHPPPVTIHTWLKHFNKQKPHSFKKATAPVDAENWISHMEKIFDVMGCEDAFKTRLVVYKFEEFKELFFLQFFPRAEQERLKREYHSIRQTNTETSTEFMQRFLRLAGFLGAAAGIEDEQAKNFQCGLRRSTLNHHMCMSYTDVAQVANAARNYEILHERDDDDTE